MKKVKITTIILAIILVTLVAFGGVYIKTQNRMEDKVKDYSFGRNLKGERVVELNVTDGSGEGETKPNAEDLTLENYETVKSTIEKRLNTIGAEDYTISLNKENGTIRVELPENETTDDYVYYLIALAKVQVKEKDTNTELLSDSMVKGAVYTYTSNVEGEYQVYLELQLTKDGQAKIDEIKNNYAIFPEEIDAIEDAQEAEKKESEETSDKTEENTNETANTETEPTAENGETKKIALLTIAGTEYDIDRIEKNTIRVKIGGQTTSTISINNNMAAAAELSMLINSGKFPIEYEVGNNRFVYSEISEMQLIYFALIVVALILVALIALTIKYRASGLLASISFIGFIAILSLILRYTNVIITIEGIGAIILAIVLNLILNKKLLERTKTLGVVNEAMLNTYKEFFLKIVPIIIITLVFSFSGWTNLSSFGMIMFWGLTLIAVYNAIVTKTLLKLKESK